jgi:hypothetical protein
MTEIDLVKHFSELATASRRLTNVIQETLEILETKDEHDTRLVDLEGAAEGLILATRHLDSVVFIMMLDEEYNRGDN